MANLDHGGRALARAVEAAYGQGETDYTLEPMVRVDESGMPIGKIRDGERELVPCMQEREVVVQGVGDKKGR